MRYFHRRTVTTLAKSLLPLCVAFCLVRPLRSAENPPSLALRLTAPQPTLVLSGSAGAVYAIQSARDLSLSSPWANRTLVRILATNQIWIDAFALSTNQQFYRAVLVPPPADTNLVFIEPGTFKMGSPLPNTLPDERPQTKVTITRGFWMGKFSVTQREYLSVAGINPSYFTPDNGYGEDLTRPVEQVSWDDAANYCAALTQQELLAGHIPTNCAYRLPTEAEFEYAYRAGTTTMFPYGDDQDYLSLTNYEWFQVNSSRMTHPVGQKLSNPWGLYDMGGNVANWCSDWHGPLPGGSVVDPQGPANGVYDQSGPGSLPFRVARVSSWDGADASSQCSFRSFYDDGFGDNNLGIRVVLGLRQ